ncbi:MAG: cysteine hydrolase, partial [Comamonas sp.]
VVIASDAHTTHDKAHASGALIRQHHNATLSAISSFGHKIVAIPSGEVTF